MLAKAQVSWRCAGDSKATLSWRAGCKRRCCGCRGMQIANVVVVLVVVVVAVVVKVVKAVVVA